MPDSNNSIRNIIFTPSQTSSVGVATVNEIKANSHRAMPFPIANIRGYFAPLLPGDTCAVQAQSSNGKSFLMNYWEKYLCRHLREQSRDEVIIHVDTENDVEALSMMEIATGSGISISRLSTGDIGPGGDHEMMAAAGAMSGIPIYRITDAIQQDDDINGGNELHLRNIVEAIKFITDGRLMGHKLKIACIFIDYLQALAIDPATRTGSDGEHHRRIQVRNDVYGIRRMGKKNMFDCPVVVGVQAKQTLTGALGPNMLIPGLYDGEETSSIGQRFDRLVSSWIPKMTHAVGDVLTHRTSSFQVKETTMFVRVNKQRKGLPSGKVWECEINYRDGSIHTV